MEKAILENGVGLFAICDEKEGSFEYWIAGLYQGGDVPEELKLYIFPESEQEAAETVSTMMLTGIL